MECVTETKPDRDAKEERKGERKRRGILTVLCNAVEK
jgi:hypothetical protein